MIFLFIQYMLIILSGLDLGDSSYACSFIASLIFVKFELSYI